MKFTHLTNLQFRVEFNWKRYAKQRKESERLQVRLELRLLDYITVLVFSAGRFLQALTSAVRLIYFKRVGNLKQNLSRLIESRLNTCNCSV